MKHVTSLLLALMLSVTSLASWAHGGVQPQHGGVVQEASDLQFELVNSDVGVTLYVMDHGKPKAVQGATGKLTMLVKGKKTEAPLVVSGANSFKAAVQKLPAGSKVVAAVAWRGDLGSGAKTPGFDQALTLD